MYEKFEIAGNGLKTMFLAQIVILVAAVVTALGLLAVPFALIGLVGIIVGGIMSLVGLFRAGPAHDYYRNAMTVCVINIVVEVVAKIAGDGFFGSLLDSVSTVLGAVMVYFICAATAELLSNRGDAALAARGQLIWKLNAGCAVAAIVCTLLAVVPVVKILAGVIGIVAGIVSLVVSVLYIMFLYQSYRSLGC